MNNNNKTVLIVLNLPLEPVSACIVRATAIVNAMTENATMFPKPPILLATVTSDINALIAAEAACKTRAAGLCTIRNDKKSIVVTDIKQLHAYVQQLANATPAQAQAIAEAAGMSVRKTAVRHKSDLAVKPVVSGTVKVVAKAVKGGLSHEWQFSTDGGKTWVNAPPTSKAEATIASLQPGVSHMFRQRVVTKNGPSDWSQPVTFLVS